MLSAAGKHKRLLK